MFLGAPACVAGLVGEPGGALEDSEPSQTFDAFRCSRRDRLTAWSPCASLKGLPR